MQQSSRDSSIWRSLAVAFGDGLAFGAGIKLAQGAARPPAAFPADSISAASISAPIDHTLLDRLADLEHRLASVERAPTPAIPAPAPFDQKVLEAVVNALDARLREQAGQIERRITELEAKIAIDMKTLERQDHAIVSGMQTRLEEVTGQYNDHIVAIRDAVAEDMDILYTQIAQIRQDQSATSAASIDARIAAAIAAHLDPRVETLELRLRDRVEEAVARASVEVASASVSRMADELAPIRAAIAERESEIAELRHRVSESDQTVLDLILAMGKMCRDVAERMSAPAPLAQAKPAVSPEPPEPPAPAPPTVDPPAANPPASAGPSEPAEAIDVTSTEINGHTTIEPKPLAPELRPSRLWRIPLVSSFLILAIGSLSLLK